jgi:MinD superfamily P-loop ATPase
MKELIVISGKGGTGKTSLMAAFAALSREKVLCDADVDAADLHLVMAPEVIREEPFVSGHKAVIRRDDCTRCGLCRELCRWDAVRGDFTVDEIACEGCGVCVTLCPEAAIDFPDSTCGQWFVSETRFGPMVHARLGIAEENSGKLVSLVRREARELARERGLELILTDGPPGIGCPVIAAIGAADAVLVVAEPSVSGIHDMERVVQLAEHFRVPAMLCINKHDISIRNSLAIEEYARQRGLKCIGRVPYDPAVTRAMVQGQTVFEFDRRAAAAKAIEAVWQALGEYL